MDRRARGDGLIGRAERGPDDVDLLARSLAPQVLARLIRRREDFVAAEDAVQEAMVEALRVWPEHLPRDARAWLAAVAMRRLVDTRRSESARRRREKTTALVPSQGPTEQGDDTLVLLFWCCHPDLSPASQIALTLRAVGGLNTREIADAFVVRRRRWHSGSAVPSGPCATATSPKPAIWPSCCACCRSFTTPEAEACGLLALMLLQHARLPARTDSAGRFVTLDEQDRSRWDTAEIAEGVAILQGALAGQCPGREPDRKDPAAVLNRAVAAVGHVAGAAAGLAETERVGAVLGDRQQWYAVRAYLCELGGEFAAAGEAYAVAAERANEVAERDHLVRRAARARARLLRPAP